MLIAEDLLLLLLDEVEGSAVVDATAADHALAGAVLAELAAAGHVAEVEPARWSKDARLVRREGALVPDELLGRMLAKLDTPRSASDQVQRLASGLRPELLERLVAAGYLREETRRVWRIFPVTRFPETDPRHETEVRAGLADVLRGERHPSAREVVLVSLLDAVGAVPKVLRADDMGVAQDRLGARVAEVVDDSEVPVAVRKAVASVRAGVDAALMVVMTTTIITSS